MGILDNLIGLVRTEPIKESSWIDYIKYNIVWFIRKAKIYSYRNRKNPWVLGSIFSLILASYVLIPTITNKNADTQIKRSKRPDKYTTGFINTGNDCFANSTIQSLVPLYELNKYFEEMLMFKIPEIAIKYPMPLHLSMMNLINKLQSTIHSPETLSVWDFLHLLENIHLGKISRSQHDAHELFAIILETLEDEYNRFFSFMSKLTDDEKKELGKIPHFPFSSVMETKLQCFSCKGISKPVKIPTMTLELMVPQSQSSTTLMDIIERERNEVIEDYSCFVCITKFIVFNTDKLKLINDEQREFIQILKESLMSGELRINDDLRENDTYKSILFNNETLLGQLKKSTVVRKNTFIETPEIIPIHLSRSMYSDTQSWKNACNVSISEILEFPTTLSSSSHVKYRLKSVIRHQGSHSSGHYECYRRKPQYLKINEDEYVNDIPEIGKSKSTTKGKKLGSVLNKPFWRISDAKISEVSTDYILNDDKAVYMLFYERLYS